MLSLSLLLWMWVADDTNDRTQSTIILQTSGIQVGMLIFVCFLGGGQEASHIDQQLVNIFWDFALHMHVSDCACIVYYRPKHSIFSSSLPANETTEHISPPGLSCPAVHSCEEQHSAERDICSVRECPNYSWSFNHSGFSLHGICGVSHKCVTATLVNGRFIRVFTSKIS